MGALFKIDQPLAAPPVVGTFGRATRQVQPAIQVDFTAQDTTHTSYDWDVISQPQESMVPGPPVAITPVPGSPWLGYTTFGFPGGYLIRLTVDAGLPTEDVSVLYLGIPLPGSGLPVPALNETIFDNSINDPPYRGWEEKLDAFMKWVDNNLGSAAAFLKGNGSPIGSVGGVEGQFYLDQLNDILYICTAPGNTDWRVI